MFRSPGSRRAAALAAFAVPLAFCPGASAAWFDAADIAGPAFGGAVVTSPTAGAVAVAGLAANGFAVGAAHAPGGAFGAPAALAPGTEDNSANLGLGGAILTSDGDRPTIRRVHADGSVSAAFPVGDSGSLPIGNAAVAPSGALLALVIDATNGDPRLWRQPNEASAPVQLTQPNLPDNASTASVVPNGNDGFIVVLSAPVDMNGGARVRGLTVSGTLVSQMFSIDESAGADDSVFAMKAIARTPPLSPLVAYVIDTPGADTLKVATVRDPPAPQTIDNLPGEDASIDTVDAAATAGGAVLGWSGTPDGDTDFAKYGLVGPTGAAVCAVAEPFSAIAVANRGGTPVAAGITADDRVGLVPAAAGCPAGTPQLSNPAPNAGDINLGVDADGTLLAAVGRGDDGALRVAVDDVTPPAVGQPGVPARSRRTSRSPPRSRRPTRGGSPTSPGASTARWWPTARR